MKEYMLLFRNEKNDGGEMPSAGQMKAIMQPWQKWISGLAQSGNNSHTGRLLPEGAVIKPGNVMTDGPYIEAKEMVGGYLVVKAHTLNEAIDIAKACPILQYGGSVEVRSIMTVDNDPASISFLEETISLIQQH